MSASVLLFVYGVNWYYLTAKWWRLRHTPAMRRMQLTSFPKVTVQIPIYNERYVVRRLLEAVARLDWPANRLEIQLLDDSNDDTTEVLVPLVASLQARGLDIKHVIRKTREGFKAGALAAGLSQASGSLIAIFDCDFCPRPDFLRAVVPEFDDSRVGFVQTRWGHLNRDFSALTRAQALGIDGHFSVEQDVRFRLGYMLNFNGTAGVWRRNCIEDAGGWATDTLAEDLDLSYRAQLRGWRCVYRKDVVCPAEIPAQINAFKRQQFRWAKGSIQVLLKLARPIAGSSLSGGRKFQAYVHLSLYMVHPLMLASFLLLSPLLLLGKLHPLVPAIFAAASLGPASMYATSQWDFSREHWGDRLLGLPFLTLLGMGLSLNNSRAVFEALLGHRSAFLRTPKFGIEGQHGNWRRSRYALRGTGETSAELLLAVYGAATTILAAAMGNYWPIAWTALFTAGFAVVALLSLVHSLGITRSRSEGVIDADVG